MRKTKNEKKQEKLNKKLAEKTKKEEKKAEKKKSARKLDKEYVPIRGLLDNATDYHTYDMSPLDKLTGFAIGFGLAALVVFVFFRSLWLTLVVGVIVGVNSVFPYKQFLIKSRRDKLTYQFKDLLEALTASYSAGKNTVEAFIDVCEDLKNIYGEDADIVKEVELINNGLSNNYVIEELLSNFAKRSGLDDIQSFADVFEVCNRQGANIKTVVSDTRTVINDKIETEMEIKTMLASGKNEINIMICMPLIIMLVLSGSGSMSVTTNTFINVIVKIICLGIFSGAYLLGRKIMDIKI